MFIWGTIQLLRLQPEEKDSLGLQNGCLCQGSELSALRIPNNVKLFLKAFVRGIYEDRICGWVVPALELAFKGSGILLQKRALSNR